jgi:RNA polymerase sigma-70 factor (ECF subfamily)
MIASIPVTDIPEDVIVHRPRLLGLAYRLLGEIDEAEDVVQEAYLRWFAADRHDVRVPEAWLVTVVTRLGLDRLRRLNTERVAYPGPWLPEPVATDETMTAASSAPPPDRAVEISSDLSVALLVLLDSLGPEERAAFLLRDVFDAEYADIARILERRQDAVRQMVARARKRVHAARPGTPAPPEVHAGMLDRFVTALAADDPAALLELLAPDVVLTSDGGGRAKAARNRILGPDRVSRLLLGLMRKFGRRDCVHRLAVLNGQPALLTFERDVLTTATMVDVVGGRIRAVYVVRNPEKLRRASQATIPIV